MLEHTASGATEPALPLDVPDDATHGARMGRYVVLGGLGAGGMGMVILAYDPDLDRRVAIKILLGDVFGGRQVDAARHNLLREAQAMARLSHPNVVTIYEAGTMRDRLFVAMEYVQGGNMRSWMDERAHSVREVLDVFLAAGRGLAAVHAAGMVHCDFKPENVLFGTDGRVRVTDFGLAGVSAHAMSGGPDRDSIGALGARDLRHGITYQGKVMGTPRYMAPEQHLALPVDAHADQFGFCVALYEALYGVRPFPDDDYPKLVDAVTSGRIAPPPRASTVPAWLHAVVVRGLSPAREHRWPSMAALLEALVADPALRRRRVASGVAVVLLAAVAAWGLAGKWSHGAALEPCAGADARVATAWNPAARARVEAAFAASGPARAHDLFTRVAARLDAYAEQWRRVHTETCRATRVRGEQSEQLLDLRMTCLERRRGALAALVNVLAGADAEMIDRAVQAAGDLPAIDGCADVETLAARMPAPRDPALAARVTALEARLDHAEALRAAGKSHQALALALPIAEEADATGHAPVRARAHALVGRARALLDEADGSERELHTAVRLASEAHDDVLLAQVLLHLSHSYRQNRGNYDAALLSARMAEATSLRSGADVLAVADAQLAESWALTAFGRFDEARTLAETAYATYVNSPAKDSPRMQTALIRLGLGAEAAGRYDEARTWDERALALVIATSGPEHPTVSSVLNNLAMAVLGQGDIAEARRLYERALVIRENAFGPDHTSTAHALNGLASVVELQDADQASKLYERALAIYEASGLNSPMVALVQTNLGGLRVRQARYPEAQTLFERARAIFARNGDDSLDAAFIDDNLAGLALAQHHGAEARALYAKELAVRKNHGTESAAYADALIGLAESHIEEGHCDAALAPLAEGTTILAKAVGAGHFRLWRASWLRGRCFLAAHQPTEAIAPLAQALALVEHAHMGPAVVGLLRFHHARALLASGHDRATVMREATLADSDLVRAGSEGERTLAELRAWRKTSAL